MKGFWKIKKKITVSSDEFRWAKRDQNVLKNELKKWGHGGLISWFHHVKNHVNKEVKRNAVKAIQTIVLTTKCNLKGKKRN